MSDFLSNFSGEKYEELVNELEEPTSKTPKKTLEETAFVDVQIIGKTEQKGRRRNREETEIDTNYQKKRNIKYGIIAASIVISCITAFAIFYLSNQVTVPNFVDKPFSEVKIWAVKNRIEVEVEQMYSVEKDETQVISQDATPDKGIQKGSIMKLQVSKGANQEEVVKLPDFATMKATAVEEWVKKNRTDNLKIVKEFSETVENGNFLRLEFKNSAITTDNYIRKEGGTLYLSKGKEVFEKNIVVPNFSKKMKVEVENWASTNKVEVLYEQTDSDEIESGQIISQSIAAEQKIAKNEQITVQVSLGKATIVPHFGEMTKEEAMRYTDNGLIVEVKEVYNPDVIYGALISQSEYAGAKLTGMDKKVEVTYSVGRPYIDDLTLMKEKDLITYFYDFRAKGANITYSVHYIDSDLPKGSVVSSNRGSEYLEMTAHIDVYISK